jgi:2-methylcitrate dehydratase PrpD
VRRTTTLAEARLCDFVAAIRWEDLPADVQERARFCLVDTIGAAIAGLATPASAIAARLAPRVWGGYESTVLLDGARASAAGAAFANATAANGTDIDDCAKYTWGHPGALVVPTALAVGERVAASGADVLAAVVAGYEVAFRISRCTHAAEAYYRACGSWGAPACAAVAARLLGLSAGQTAEAVGIAEYNAPDAPMWRDVQRPAMVKHAIGWGAATGITAALLAAEGFTGVPSVAVEPRFEPWLASIGEEFLITSCVTWKRHSTCAWTHPAIVALQRLLERVPFSAADVRAVEVIGYSDACKLYPDLPATSEEAQFSLPWALAAYLRDREVSPAHMLEGSLEDPELRRLAAAVSWRESDEFTRLYRLSEEDRPGGAEMAQVVVTLRDGRSHDSGPVRFELYPEGGWSRAEMDAKFTWLVGPVIGERRAAELLGRLWRLDAADDATDLVGSLTEAVQTTSTEDPARRSGGQRTEVPRQGTHKDLHNSTEGES